MSDLRRVIAKLAELDPFKEMSKDRPNTKWRLVLLTNIRFSLFNTDFTLGSHKIYLPEHIKNSHSIVPLDKDPVTKHAYTDNLCAFRCLCLHKYGSVDHTKIFDLFRQWNALEDPECFEGIYFSDLLNFEQCFEVNVHVYELGEDGVAHPIFKSPDRYDETMYVNNFSNHLSYITDFRKYAKKYRCILCDKLFDHIGHFKHHAKMSIAKQKFVYPGGFINRPTPFLMSWRCKASLSLWISGSSNGSGIRL